MPRDYCGSLDELKSQVFQDSIWRQDERLVALFDSLLITARHRRGLPDSVQLRIAYLDRLDDLLSQLHLTESSTRDRILFVVGERGVDQLMYLIVCLQQPEMDSTEWHSLTELVKQSHEINDTRSYLFLCENVADITKMVAPFNQTGLAERLNQDIELEESWGNLVYHLMRDSSGAEKLAEFFDQCGLDSVIDLTLQWNSHCDGEGDASWGAAAKAITAMDLVRQGIAIPVAVMSA